MAATFVALPRQPHSSHRPALSRLSASDFILRAACATNVLQLQFPRTTTSPKSVIIHHSLNSIQRSQKHGVNARSGMVMGDHGDDIDDDDDEEDEEEEEDRTLDLLIRFVENMFRKVSRRARKAVRSVLPVPISAKLVGFAVNGTIILTFLWVLKAFLQVICTLGSVVFASILLIRGIWTGISYFQESHNYRIDDDDHRAWTGGQPAI